MGKPVRRWRCFHCDEVFADKAAAADHFGATEIEEPACKLNVVEGQLVTMLREAHAELRQLRAEEGPTHRDFYALGIDHFVTAREAEETGYRRGLRDGDLHVADMLRGFMTGVTPMPRELLQLPASADVVAAINAIADWLVHPPRDAA